MSNKNTSFTNSTPFSIFISIFSIALGIFFIFTSVNDKPIPRNEAVAYSGEFSSHEEMRNSCTIYMVDGSYYHLYPHTNTQSIHSRLDTLERGTAIYILVNPNNDYVAEIRTDTEELLNFELSQKDIYTYDNGYILVGSIAVLAGVLLIAITVGSFISKKKEARKDKSRNKSTSSKALRCADNTVKHKVLLEAQVDEYKICYRRVKSINELVVNGMVYDEKRGVVEFAHRLIAVIGNHTIEAGLDEDSFSYIRFDGEIIATKERLI